MYSFAAALLVLLPAVGQAFTVHPQILKQQQLSASRRCNTLYRQQQTVSSASSDDNGTSSSNNNMLEDTRFYNVRLSRALGIDWGADLSFRYVYVRGMDPTGAAARSGKVQTGDYLCQQTAVVTNNKNETTAVATEAPNVTVNLVGAPFDYVMQSFADLDKTVQEVDLVFFRGTKEELQALVQGDSDANATITVTVVQKSNNNEQQQTVQLQAPVGVNVRDLLLQNNINPYQSLTRWTNCKGKQLCGTCIVNVCNGQENTNRKSVDEESTLRDNPDNYRLSCVTFAYGDCVVETFPPVKAYQWTR
jgi:ferredoxin